MFSATALLLLLSFPQSEKFIEVSFVTDEAESVLAILEKRERGIEITQRDWDNLFFSEGYTRLKEREESIGRSFTEEDFQKFVLSESLISRKKALRKTLETWKKCNLMLAAQKALAYLPKDTKIKAKVILLIKPQTNSFVWDLQNNPAVMLYLDTTMSPEEFDATITHEFHHIGYANSCPNKEFKEWLSKQTEETRNAFMWLSAFGEGFAVLAQSEGKKGNPYGYFRRDVRYAWIRNYANVYRDMKTLEDFFDGVFKGKWNKEEVQKKGYEFFGLLGPWYTVGYLIAVTIEDAFGRAKLIECFSDPRILLSTYNDAAKKLKRKQPLFSESLVKKFEGEQV
ncbi:MAG TPA: DUF5700 domain-containing putative Zn-dependent protease [Fimbriimonadales bacterium]|nr:DUF5700 domain-containing putative Zn-dependent protease [Fimbriimonadales bacterium]